MTEDRMEEIARDPRYIALVRTRTRLAWCLSIAVVAAFTAFILVIALDKALLATPIAGHVTSWGIPVGFALILFSIATIAMFTRRANRRFDPIMARILADHAE